MGSDRSSIHALAAGLRRKQKLPNASVTSGSRQTQHPVDCELRPKAVVRSVGAAIRPRAKRLEAVRKRWPGRHINVL
jgi:hypothetical protein